MLKFTVTLKKLNPIINNVSMVVDRKSTVPSQRKVYFQITDEQKLRVYGSDSNHFLEMVCDAVYGIENGKIEIDVNDLNIITKMTGSVTVTETGVDNKPMVIVKNKNKCVMLPAYNEGEVVLPERENKKPFMEMDGSWLLETISKLSCFTIDDKMNSLQSSISFNTRTKYAEAFDGSHAGLRKMPQEVNIYREGNIMLRHQSFPVLKKLLSKKPSARVLVLKDEKYIEISGEGFTYVIRGVEDQFFDIKRVLGTDTCYPPYRIVVNKEEFMKVIQYENDLIKKNRMSFILHGMGGRVFSYFNSGRYQILNEIGVEKLEMPKDFFVGFKTYQMLNILNVLDTETIELRIRNAKSCVYVEGNECIFLIYPIHVKSEDKEAIKHRILDEHADSFA